MSKKPNKYAELKPSQQQNTSNQRRVKREEAKRVKQSKSH